MTPDHHTDMCVSAIMVFMLGLVKTHANMPRPTTSSYSRVSLFFLVFRLPLESVTKRVAPAKMAFRSLPVVVHGRMWRWELVEFSMVCVLVMLLFWLF